MRRRREVIVPSTRLTVRIELVPRTCEVPYCIVRLQRLSFYSINASGIEVISTVHQLSDLLSTGSERKYGLKKVTSWLVVTQNLVLRK